MSVVHIIARLSGTTISLLAGKIYTAGYVDDIGSNARFNSPQSICVDPTGTTLYVGDGFGIRKVVISTRTVSSVVAYVSGSGGGLACDSTSLYYTEPSLHAIFKVTLPSTKSTFAGSSNTPGYIEGTGTAARFYNPYALAINSSYTTLYIADTFNFRIRTLSLPGTVTSNLCGNGTDGTTDTQMRLVKGITIGFNQRVTFTEFNRVRRFNPLIFSMSLTIFIVVS
jgi:hypothetical protein